MFIQRSFQMSAPLEPHRCHSDLSHPQARGGSWGPAAQKRIRLVASARRNQKAALPLLAPPLCPTSPHALAAGMRGHSAHRFFAFQCKQSCAALGSDSMGCFRVCAYGLCLRAAAPPFLLASYLRWQMFCQCLLRCVG